MNTQPPVERLASIDILRGLVMILMTLDHTRDFFSNAHFSPTDLNKTSVALFLTRWITHYCAPIFVFLAGTSAYLWQAKRGHAAPISRYLAGRGLLLLLLTSTVEAWAWNFRNDFQMLDGGVLWAIGWSMLVLSVLVKLPLRWVVLIGGVMIGTHNAFDNLQPSSFGAYAAWWSVLHTGNKVALGADWGINPYYPLIPWIGVMAVGYGFGLWMSTPQLRTRRHLCRVGGTCIAAFILLRYSNLYGDPKPWQNYPDIAFTLLSFLNCHKYPPSLLYILMTLGPALVILGLLVEQKGEPFELIKVFGRMPLFFYLTHLYVIHLLALGVAAIDHGPVAELIGGGIWSKDIPTDYGYSLASVYGFWLVVLLLMYALCRSLESLKLNKSHWRWLRYL